MSALSSPSTIASGRGWFAFLYCLGVGGLVGFAIVPPTELWFVSRAGAPGLVATVILAVYVFLAVGLHSERWPWIRNLTLALCLWALYESCRVPPLGDYAHVWGAVHGRAFGMSEPGAGFVWHLVGSIFGDDAVTHVCPFLGFVTAWAFLGACESLFVVASEPGAVARRRFCALLYGGCGVHLVFFRDYVEDTQMTVPLLILSLGALWRYLRTDATSGQRARRSLIASAVWLGVAITVHGQSCFLMPALPIAVLVHRGAQGELRRGWREVTLAMAVAVTTVAALVGLILGLGFELVMGLALGSETDSWMVPLFTDVGGDGPGLLTLAHLRQTANILILATPLTLIVPVLALALRRGPRWYLALPALGYFGFVLLFEFDLGMPTDYDLMLTLSFPFCLAACDLGLAAARRSPRAGRVGVGMVAVALPLSWLVMAPLLTSGLDAPQPIDPRRGAMRVNGVAASGIGPLVLDVPGPGGQLEIEVTGPPGATVTILVGPRSAGRYWKNVGTVQVGTPPDFADNRQGFRAVLTGAGRFTFRVPFADRQPGPFLDFQAIIEQPEGSRVPFIFTPAAYVGVRR